MNFISALLAPFFALGALFASSITPPVVAPLGASQPIPTTIAFFETTLAAAITDSATSFTLTSATDKDGTTLASSTYAFVIDEGSSNEEIVIADCTSTACTNALRGVSVRTGNTEVTALKKAHRRGASIKITDAPVLPLISRVLRGEGTVSFTPSENYSLVTKTYVDSLALGTTTVSATESDDGIVELATGLEAASSTALGGSGSSLALQAKYATSSPYTTGHFVPVTGIDGKLSSSFFPTSLASSSIQVFSTTGTSSYQLSSGVKYIVVDVQGGGGGGGETATAGTGGGGGGGGFARAMFPAAALSASTTVVVASSSLALAAGGHSQFGTTVFGYGGTASTGEQDAGVGGTATGGYLNISGQSGHGGGPTGESGGGGGDSILGFGGAATIVNTGGKVGTGYGGGGSGGRSSSSDNRIGGGGAQGIVIVYEFY